MSTNKTKRPKIVKPPLDVTEYLASMEKLSLIQAAPYGSGMNRLSDIMCEIFLGKKPK